jgi:hypothetical protein
VKIKERYQQIRRKNFNENTACIARLQKSFANSEASGVMRLRTYKFKTILKGEFKKYLLINIWRNNF